MKEEKRDSLSNTQTESIKPPIEIGERWFKARKKGPVLKKIIREIKRPFRQLHAPIDIWFNRYKKLRQAEQEFPEVWSLSETVDLLIQGASICRYGDGEFGSLLFPGTSEEDSYRWKLSKRLSEVLSVRSSEKLVIAIPPFNSEYCNVKNRYGWLNFWENYWSLHWSLLRERLMHRSFGNAFVSRDAVYHEVSLEKIRSIWEGRDVVFVVGRNGRFFDEPRLFDNIRSKEYLFVDPRYGYAFRDYEETLRKALTYDKNKLFFISAGQLATILAYDLFQYGYQALDMGHLPNCFREYLKEAPRPEWIAEVVVR